MTLAEILRKILFGLSLLLATSHAMAQVRYCHEAGNLDFCVNKSITEAAAFIDECSRALPHLKSNLDAAFDNWSVLKLPIPDIQKALEPKSFSRLRYGQAIASFFAGKSKVKIETECNLRIEMMRNPEPQIRFATLDLPENALEKYKKKN